MRQARKRKRFQRARSSEPCPQPMGQVLVHGLAVRAQHVPVAAELVHRLAEDLAGLVISRIEVDGVPGIGRLELAVAPASRADQAAPDTGAGRRLRLHDVWRPGGCAVAGAVAALSVIGGEEIEGPASAVGEDAAVVAVPDLHAWGT